MKNTSSSQEHQCHPLLGKTVLFTLEHQQHYDNFFLFILVINVLCSVCAICSNAVVICTVIKTASLHVPSNVLILGLAMADFAISMVSQPSYSMMKYSEYTRNLPLFCWVGIIYHVSVTGLFTVSFLTLTAITTDRFLAVKLHLRYQGLVTIPRYIIVLVIIWCVSIFSGTNRLISDTLTMTIVAFICGMVAFVANLYFLLKIHFIVKRHKVRINSQRAKFQTLNMTKFKKSVNTLHCVVGGILLCYLPLTITLIVHFLFHDKSNYPILAYFAFSETCLMSNSVVNPAIYFWKNKELREAAKRVLWKKNEILRLQRTKIFGTIRVKREFPDVTVS